MTRRAAISGRMPAVVVEYDGHCGQRASKHFDNAYEARRFYSVQFKAGKNPTVRKPK